MNAQQRHLEISKTFFLVKFVVTQDTDFVKKPKVIVQFVCITLSQILKTNHQRKFKNIYSSFLLDPN